MITHNVGVAGFFKFEAVKENGETRELTDWFQNIILDTGLEKMGTGSFVTRCEVGSGSSTPVVTQTALDSLVAGTTNITNTTTGATSSEPYYGYVRKTFTFSAGTAAGVLTEVGVGWTGGLFSRSLIKDSLGNPTSITVLAEESLIISYELRVFPSLTDSVVNIDISGVTYAVTCRAASVTSWYPSTGALMGIYTTSVTYARVYNGSIGAITTTPSGSTSNVYATSDIVNLAYVPGSYCIDSSIKFSLSVGNLSGGITALRTETGLGNFQYGFSPAIPKTADNVLTLSHRISWVRV